MVEELLPNQLKDLEEHRAAVERLNSAKNDYMKKYGVSKPPDTIADIIDDMTIRDIKATTEPEIEPELKTVEVNQEESSNND